MTQFEFISAAASIVLALSIARLLGALPHVLAPGRRYWIHALWALTLVPAHLGFWWAIWTYRGVDPWSFRGFVALMITPVFMFLTVTTLVTDGPGAIASWRDHFFARRRSFFTLYLVVILSVPIRHLVVTGDLGLPFTREGLALLAIPFFLGISVVGVIATAERVQAILVLAVAGFTLLNFARL